MGFKDFVKKNDTKKEININNDLSSFGFYRLSADGNIVRTTTLYIDNGEIIFSFDDKKLYIWKKSGLIDKQKPDVVLNKFDLAKIVAYLYENGYI